MVIIRSMLHLPGYDMERLIDEINAQAQRGVIVLPSWCELLNEVPADEEIKVIQPTDADRVAELERELAAAMAYITSIKDCDTCKHRIKTNAPCEMMDYDCYRCNCMECICKSCYGASNWEWRGASGIG